MTGAHSLWPARSADRLLLLAAVLFPFLALGSAPLFDLDEGAFTASTTEMFLRGDFLSSYLHGVPRHDKPILIYWLQAASVSLLGPHEFAWRLPSALASSAWITLTYLFVSRVADRNSGLTAALMIATAAGLTVITRAATADALLNLWLAGAGYAAWLWLREGRQRWLYLGYLAMALGFLTKGPIAVLIPAGAVFLWCASRRQWLALRRSLLAPGPILLFFAVAAPWFIIQTYQEGMGFLSGFFLKHNLSRFDAPMEGHGGNPFYYVPVLLLSLLPFTGVLLAALSKWRTIWGDDLMRFGLLWFALVFVLFSFSGTKLPHYLYYGYSGLIPVLAILVGHHLSRFLALAGGILLFGLLLALPGLLESATPGLKADDRLLLAHLWTAFSPSYWFWCAGGFAISLVLLLPRTGGLRAALHINGTLAGLSIVLFLMPLVGQIQQGPVKAAGLVSRNLSGPLVLFGNHNSSFQTYAGRLVEKRIPRSGDLVLTRESRLEKLPTAQVVFRERGYVLVRIP